MYVRRLGAVVSVPSSLMIFESSISCFPSETFCDLFPMFFFCIVVWDGKREERYVKGKAKRKMHGL